MRIYFLILLLLVMTGFTQEFKLLSPEILDLGTVMDDSIVSGKIQFVNNGNLPMRINQIDASCGCTTTKLEKLIYEPGEVGEIGVQFNTKNQSGLVRKSVHIIIENLPMATVVIQANVHKYFEITPYIDLQNIKIQDSTVKRSLVITNNYKEDLVVNHIKGKIVVVDSSYFLLRQGESKTIEVSYTPKIQGGYDDIIEIEITSPIQKIVKVPVFIRVEN